MANFYTADLHFDHKNIIEHCNRPFDSLKEMNETIIRRINERCGKNDTLYILGDVSAFKANPVPYLKQINAKKVLIRGNHDASLLQHRSFRSCFEYICRETLLTDGNYDLYLSHYPMAEWDGYWKGRYLFYGHVHNSDKGGSVLMQFLPSAINVGVDMNIFYPMTAFELIENRIKNYRVPDMDIKELINSVTLAQGDDRSKKSYNPQIFFQKRV